jgi:hypothetical protein
MRPSTVYNMKPGEREVIRAFIHYELEERETRV